MKTAVVLVNLGGPDSQQEIRPFLFNIFNDSDLIKFPAESRKNNARWYASQFDHVLWGDGSTNTGISFPLVQSPLLLLNSSLPMATIFTLSILAARRSL